MDGAKIRDLVEAYVQESAGSVNLYEFAARVADGQREETALIFESLGFNDIAAKVRAS
jgi:hypothetical protein